MPTVDPILASGQIIGQRDTLFWSLGLLQFGLLCAFFLVPCLRKWALHRGIVDAVDPVRKAHKTETPRIGGVALVVPFLIGTALLATFLHPEMVEAALAKEWIVMILGCIAMFALGFWDDLHPLGAKLKLFFHVIICCVVATTGFQLDAVTNPFGGGVIDLGFWGWLIAAFWLLSTTNLINLVDGADGLAGGICLIIFISLALTMWFTAGVTMFLLCILMSGVLLGFLIHNFPPARIFMGDGGAYFLGFLIGQIGLAGEHKSTVAAAMVVPLLALGVPIIDTTLAILRRGIRGLPIFRADREHMHHRLLDLGMSPQRTVMAIYLVCVIFCALGLVVFFNQGKGLALSLSLVFMFAVAAVWLLRYFRKANPWEQLRMALNVRDRTGQFVVLCETWKAHGDKYRSIEDFLEKFWEELRELNFCALRFVRADQTKTESLSFGEEPEEGNFLAIKLPVISRQKVVGTLELDIDNMEGLSPMIWERHAGLVRDVVSNWFDKDLS